MVDVGLSSGTFLKPVIEIGKKLRYHLPLPNEKKVIWNLSDNIHHIRSAIQEKTSSILNRSLEACTQK